MKKVLLFALTLLMLFCFAACGGGSSSAPPSTAAPSSGGTSSSAPSTAATGEPIYIAVQAPFTGDNAQYGEFIYNGVELKVNQVNEAGGINGRPIVLEKYDDKNDSNEAATLAQMICDENKYVAVFGGYASGATLACAPVYRKNNMFHIAPTASHVDVTEAGGTSWAMSLDATIEYSLMGQMAVEDVGNGEGTKIALVHLNADNGIIIRDSITLGVGDAGGEVVAVESYINGQVRDFLPILNKIKASNPDVVCIAVQYADAAAMLIQAQQVGFGDDVKFMLNNDCFVRSIFEAGGDALEGVYVDTPWSVLSPEPGIQKFREDYNKAYGSDPAFYASNPYEAINMVVAALEDGAETSADLQAFFTNMGDWEGQTFSGHFGENQRFVRSGKLVLAIIKDGDWEIVPTT